MARDSAGEAALCPINGRTVRGLRANVLLWERWGESLRTRASDDRAAEVRPGVDNRRLNTADRLPGERVRKARDSPAERVARVGETFGPAALDRLRPTDPNARRVTLEFLAARGRTVRGVALWKERPMDLLLFRGVLNFRVELVRNEGLRLRREVLGPRVRNAGEEREERNADRPIPRWKVGADRPLARLNEARDLPIPARPKDARPIDARDARPIDALPMDARPIDARPERPTDARPIDARPERPAARF